MHDQINSWLKKKFNLLTKTNWRFTIKVNDLNLVHLMFILQIIISRLESHNLKTSALETITAMHNQIQYVDR